jgi:4-hydroxy-3-methylbut-2-en-1-yl diphosphate reductase
MAEILSHAAPPLGNAVSVRPEVELLLASPRGFCAGVRRAIDAVRDALAVHGAPVYVRRPIVHNLAVVRDLEAEGAIFVEELAQVPAGAVVIFSAHGVPTSVYEEARERGLRFYDAVCPLVAKVHRQVERYDRDDRQIILIGHEGHPEVEGTLGRLPAGRAFVVKSIADVAKLPIDKATPVAVAVQTTYSVEEAGAILEALRARFTDLVEPPSSDICYATTNRQAAVGEIAGQAAAVIVVGEPFSSNARRLAEVASLDCARVQLVPDASHLDWSHLPLFGAIGVTAAASTPESSVQGVIEALASRYEVRVRNVRATEETNAFKRVVIG